MKKAKCNLFYLFEQDKNARPMPTQKVQALKRLLERLVKSLQ